MLPSIEFAYDVHGPTKKAVAAQCNVSVKSIWKWFAGYTRAPKHKRQSIDAILGFGVDWVQYDLEVDACLRPLTDRLADEQPKVHERPDTVAPVDLGTMVGDHVPVNDANDAFQSLYGDFE